MPDSLSSHYEPQGIHEKASQELKFVLLLYDKKDMPSFHEVLKYLQGTNEGRRGIHDTCACC